MNLFFNLLAVIFSLFSMTLLIPFLDLIFVKGDDEFKTYYENGVGAFNFSIESAIDLFNYHLSKLIMEAPSITEGKASALLFLCIVIVFSFFFKNLFGYLALFVMAKVRNGVLKDLRENTYKKLLVLPLSYYSEEKKGDIISKMSNDVVEIEWSVLLGIELVFREPLSIILFLSTMVYMSPKLTIFVFLMLPLTALVIGQVGNSLKRTSGLGQQMAGDIIAALEETLGGLRIIKAFNAEDSSIRKFEGLNLKYFNLMVKMYRKRDLASPMSEFLGVGILVIILWFGGQIVLDGEMDSSVFIAFIMLFSQIISPAKSLAKAWYNVQKGAASADRLGDLVNAKNVIEDIPNATVLNGFDNAIEYNSVSFKYDKDLVLKDVSFKIEKGKTVALVGASGGGKSTLADLLPRFYDPVKGAITIDEVAINLATVKSVRSLMGIVTQQSILFNDTIHNNIAFGAENVSEAEVIEAAKIANAHDFITQFPEGYQSNIGDGGGKLSGGQKQRISIARAILKNPPILILDEATSALDTESEQLVQTALNNLMKNRTSLVIAHRLSTIQSADKILVMDQGQIAEQGTHTELLALQGIYYNLCQLQSFS
ncbi:ABC transporter ATP-binding protein/permease [Salibacteraceae bacterium]|jgi:subfamily B ATP-binding cassette protein MsbA|nr:ABC transporter ATP-binding protein/permease [Salibacteraceae bacterium]MDB0058030.1 ABC transporter ATP-binding protein/permease [Salibacteraceae bacterium]MDC1204449.1 ABC transporter ATP-binding protein/permease [Salibacteraceae bacterium]|tara:strand:- start:11521 stop:13311 length:1791 start_codon:yes stop_codon:yes gene_type:complete